MYQPFLGHSLMQLHVQPFGEDQMATYIRHRLRRGNPRAKPGARRCGRGPAPRSRDDASPGSSRDVAPAPLGGAEPCDAAAQGSESRPDGNADAADTAAAQARVDGVLEQIRDSRLRAMYCTPFVLNMGMDLLPDLLSGPKPRDPVPGPVPPGVGPVGAAAAPPPSGPHHPAARDDGCEATRVAIPRPRAEPGDTANPPSDPRSLVGPAAHPPTDPVAGRTPAPGPAGAGLAAITQRADLYARWLWRQFQTKGSADPAEDLQRAEALAWALHTRGISHDRVGARGAEGWFRRCPLRVHDFHPKSIFSFQHKSLQEYLVAAYLWRALRTDGAAAALAALDVTRDLPVLQFFATVYQSRREHAATRPETAVLQRTLLDAVLRSCAHPERGPAAANALSLLNAASVSLSGLDLSGICAPGANLQCAQLHGSLLVNAGRVCCRALLRRQRPELSWAALGPVLCRALPRGPSGIWHALPRGRAALSPPPPPMRPHASHPFTPLGFQGLRSPQSTAEGRRFLWHDAHEQLGLQAAAQPQCTNYWALRTRKRRHKEHRPQRPSESIDPTKHAKGTTCGCPGPCKETRTRRNVMQGGGGMQRVRGGMLCTGLHRGAGGVGVRTGAQGVT